MSQKAENDYSEIHDNGLHISRLTWSEIIHQLGNAPNVLSVSRIVFIPFVIFLIKYDITPWSVIALCALWITDYIDGYIARTFRQETELGLLLDPVADKLTSAALFITLYLYRDFPLWIVIVVLSRDFLILCGAYFLVRRRRIYSSSQLGRITTALISVIILLYVLNLQVYSLWLCYLLVVLTAATTFSYGLRFMKSLGEIKSETHGK
ncbi:MAG: CDP-alcohol phosphatidyltransferase family protein [Deltaproteobacteria bacterium]|nr:CDP-alcohol phosphatidyltransferase family protein [Deltaproteobacteria bacterium]